MVRSLTSVILKYHENYHTKSSQTLPVETAVMPKEPLCDRCSGDIYSFQLASVVQSTIVVNKQIPHCSHRSLRSLISINLKYHENYHTKSSQTLTVETAVMPKAYSVIDVQVISTRFSFAPVVQSTIVVNKQMPHCSHRSRCGPV